MFARRRITLTWGIIIIVTVGLTAVGFADVLLKWAGERYPDSFLKAVFNPQTLYSILLYNVQVFALLYGFYKRVELSLVGIFQVVIYAAIALYFGKHFFHEQISLPKMFWAIAAVISVVMMKVSK